MKKISSSKYQVLKSGKRGMTLIETLVAITILAVAIVAPMSLTTQSLSAAYYARDQITAFNLAQEAIESVRSVRDGNILRIAYNVGGECNQLLCGIFIGTPFTIDTRNNDMDVCTLADGADPDTLPDCPPLKTDGTFYGYPQEGAPFYDVPANWSETRYTRTIVVDYVPNSESPQDEIRIAVTVSWEAGRLQTRTFTIYENLYRWVNDGSI